MTYTVINFKTRKALHDAVARGQKIRVYEPGIKPNTAFTDETVYLEGPHYPEPHTWYAEAWLQDGYIVRVK